MEKNKGGRPTKKQLLSKHISEAMTKLTPEMIQKLEQAFALDCSIGEICYYCDISNTTYYNWRDKNPELFNKLARLRERPVLKARQEVVKGIENDKEFALKYLNKKKKEEFGDSLKLDGQVEFSYNLKVIDNDDRPNIDKETKGSV